MYEKPVSVVVVTPDPIGVSYPADRWESPIDPE